jgi:hypothetical protein
MKHRLQQYLSRKPVQLSLIAAAFAVVGLGLMQISNAATYATVIEAEAGSLAGQTRLAAAQGASGGNVVTFGVAPVGGGGSGGQPGQKVYAYRMFGGDDNIGRIGAANLTKYQVYLLSPYMTNMATAIKQANPSAQIYMYKDPTSSRTTAGCVDQAIGRDWGVDYCDAQAHPAWFMTKGGQPFQYGGYAGHWHMDVGAAGYKEKYASNVLADLRKTPAWSGVFLDNMMADITAYAGGYPDQYKTQAAGQAAYGAFMDYVGPQLKAAGYGTMGNNNGARLVPGLWAKYTNGATGGYDEFWTTFGTENLAAYDGVGWDAQIAEAELLSQQGKLGVWTAQTKNGACKSCQVYGFASYLLIADGKQAYAEGSVDDQVGNWIDYAPMYSWDLGKPTTGKLLARDSIYVRRYERGIAIVNASKSSASFTLDTTYIDDNGKPITTLDLGATSAAVLRTP